MTPGLFDLETCREVTGDTLARGIESNARGDADAKVFSCEFKPKNNSYWSAVLCEMKKTIYFEQYKKRWERNLRKLNLTPTK